MALTKMNKTFTAGQILTTAEMNAITTKIDQIIDNENAQDNRIVYDSTNKCLKFIIS